MSPTSYKILPPPPLILASAAPLGQGIRHENLTSPRILLCDPECLLMSTAFLFPGQGSQTTGMGKTLADAFPSARAVFQEADDALGFSLSQLCFEGPDDSLKLTENTQP